MSRSVRPSARTGSRVPHGTVETEVPPVERDHQAVRRACVLLRDPTLALSLFLDEHGRVFTPGPAPGNPPKRDSVVKVLERVYYVGVSLSSVLARGAIALPAGSGLFIPRFKTEAFKPDML